MLYCNVSYYDIIEYRNMKFIYYGLSTITYYSKKCLVNEKNSVFFYASVITGKNNLYVQTTKVFPQKSRLHRCGCCSFDICEIRAKVESVTFPHTTVKYIITAFK
jgi:hypothetical protein